MDAGFTLDGKIMSLTDKEFRIWLNILSEISLKYNGTETEFKIDLNRLLIGSKSRATKLLPSCYSLATKLLFTIKPVANEYELIISYPKYLKKQESYFRGVCTKNKTMQDNKIKIKEEEKDVDLEEEKEASTCIEINQNKDIGYNEQKNNILPSGKKAPKILTSSQTWEAYKNAYLARYKVEPLRNATVNSQLSAFIKRVGIENAPDIVKFYVSHNNYYYVKNCHKVGLLLYDAEKLTTEWKTGNKITDQRARQVDQTQTNFDAIDRGFAIADEIIKKRNDKNELK